MGVKVGVNAFAQAQFDISVNAAKLNTFFVDLFQPYHDVAVDSRELG